MAHLFMFCGFNTDDIHIKTAIYCDIDRNLYRGLIHVSGERIEVPIPCDIDSLPCVGFVTQHLECVTDREIINQSYCPEGGI